MNSWFSPALDFLSHSTVAVFLVAGLILAGALLLWVLWFRPATMRLQTALTALSRAFDSAPGAPSGWTAVLQRARAAAQENANIRSTWRQTEDRVLPLQHDAHTLFVMFGPPRDLWDPRRLLARSINVALFDAVPNLLVGLGLLLTFFFLTLALTQATSALLPGGAAGPVDLTDATRGLLSAAGAKFSTSLAGLAASIAWTIAARRRMRSLDRATEDILEKIESLILVGGGEMIMFAHLQATRELKTQAVAQIAAATEGVEKAQQQLDLTRELLDESREQTGTFKRFETDLAVSMAGAITTAFSPQMEDMTNRLIEAIDGLSSKMSTMNQEALQRMMEDFAGMLRKGTESEMVQLRATLEMLAEQLTGAGQTIGAEATRAAENLDKAGADLLARVEQVSTNLTTGAANLEAATQGVKEAMNDLDVTINTASSLGKRGAEVVGDALDTAAAVFDRLKSASEEIQTAGAALERVTGQLTDALDGVEELTEEQRAVVSAVKDATPEALALVKEVVDLLQRTVESTATTMAQTKDSMAATSKTMSATVSEITVGVSEYSKTVAVLHRKMDEQLAKALGGIDKTVNELTEAIEELSELLPEHSK